MEAIGRASRIFYQSGTTTEVVDALVKKVYAAYIKNAAKKQERLE